MKINLIDNRLVISPEGRLDSNNAPAAEEEIMKAVAEHAGCEICFDMGALEYISSAGLRVIMKVRKKSGKPVDAVNVSRDVYDIFEMTGFTEMLRVQKAYRKVKVDGLEMIGSGFFGTVYRLDKETIIKVYKGKDSIPMIKNEKKMAQKAFLAGIPTAISYDIVQVGEDYGSIFELLDSETFHDMAAKEEQPIEQIVAKYADLLKLVHHTEMEKGEFPSYKERFLDHLELIKKHLTEEQYTGLKGLFSAMPDENTVVHGDIQMKNVMSCGDEPMLIDMDTIGLGDPVFDFAGLYVTYQAFEEDDPGNSMAFLGISQEKTDLLWKLIMETYFAFENEEERQRILARIRLVAAVRFLYILETTDLKNSELGRIRIARTGEHIDELLPVVDRLAIEG